MTTNFDEKPPKTLGYSPMLNLVKQDKIDGFFVSRDNESLFKDLDSVEKLKLIPIPATDGTLYIKPDAYERYGYETQEDFAYDCANTLLECKSPQGALTLGPTRKLTAPTRVYLYGSGLNAAPCFLADSPHQAEAIKTILEKAYPGSSFRFLANDQISSLERLKPGMNQSHWRILLFDSQPVIRTWFRRLVGCAFMVVLCLLFNAMGYIGQAPAWIFLVFFFICFFVFTGLARIANTPATAPQKNKRKRTPKS